MANTAIRDASSFRDPEGYVFHENGYIKRKLLSQEAKDKMKTLLASSFYQDMQKSGRLIPTHWDSDVLIHEKVPVVTYPYEWSFNMLKDAALGQLSLMKEGIEHGFILKDGTGFNSLYHNGNMVFVDLLSIDKYQGGQMWEGYHQYCEHFLFPMMLSGYKNVPFQNWWRGNLDGIKTADIYNLLSFKDYFKKGVIKNVVLPYNLGKKITNKNNIKKNFNSATFPKGALLSFINVLMQTTQALNQSKDATTWEDYADNNSYSNEEKTVKMEFIAKHLKTIAPLNQMIDIGANTGDYSVLASEFSNKVISLDFDINCVDKLYLKIKNDSKLSTKIIPMIGDVVNFSPNCGWDINERTSQISRVASDCFLALALIHHICISKNVPISHFLEFISKIGTYGVLEWVDIKDSMAQQLIRNRKDIFADYTWEHFKIEVEKHFQILNISETHSGNRKLCFIKRKY